LPAGRWTDRHYRSENDLFIKYKCYLQIMAETLIKNFKQLSKTDTKIESQEERAHLLER